MWNSQSKGRMRKKQLDMFKSVLVYSQRPIKAKQDPAVVQRRPLLVLVR